MGTAATTVLCIALLGLAACQRSAPDTPASPKEAASEPAEEGVSLTAEQVQKAGIVAAPAQSIEYRDEVDGYALVIPHDTIAAAVAELSTAQAARQLSRASAARAQRLAGTPGALSADAVETATRQVATDAAAETLARQRLSSIVGSGAPTEMTDAAALARLANGETKLLRATFPLGALQGSAPASLRVARLDGVTPVAAPGAQPWIVRPVWAAPADANLPGRSFFALLKGGDAGEGERLLVWAPGPGPEQRGVLVPSAALIISAGKYWCYTEREPGDYLRREVATDRPSGDGYVVLQGIAAGDRIVTGGASLLLAREMNSSTEAD